MKIVCFIGKLLSGIIAIVSGLFSLLINDVTIPIYNNMTDLQKYFCIGIVILAGAFIIVTTIIDACATLSKSSRKFKFKYQSKRFIKYFEKWYGQSGELSIICDDLDWTRTNTNDVIYRILVLKSINKKLSLYLGPRGIESDIAKELKTSGAKVFKAPTGIVNLFTFSCMSVMGNMVGKIIVRNKDHDTGETVIFEEINNTYITKLLNELMHYSKRANNKNEKKQ